MIITKPKAEFLYEGETYRIGATVIANEKSAYEGLVGEICEIRTGEDKETENEMPEIFCRFEPPKLSADITELEKRFSDACAAEKKIEDIPLDSVIMSPEMLICPDNDKNKEKIYVLTEEWANDGDGGFNTEVFTDALTAKAFLNFKLSKEMSDGLIAKWQADEELKFEEDESSYTAWVDGYYTELHYTLKIEVQKMTVSPGFVSGIGNRYLEKCRYEDFYSRVSEWEDAEKLNEEEWQRFISDARIPEEINAGLSDTYRSEYWNAVCEAAHKLLNEYLEKHSEETK